MRAHSLLAYVISVVIGLAIAIAIVWSLRGPAYAARTAIFAAGFLLGMVAMYIAVHVYWDIPIWRGWLSRPF